MDTPALHFIRSAFAALHAALPDHGSDLRNVQLATLSPDGRPALRTLVLRAFDAPAACAEMHSDARAAKVTDIAANPQVALLAWSLPDQLQLRFDGTARLHRADAVARDRWDKLSPGGRAAYGLQARSGSPVDDPEPQPHLPPDGQFGQFTVIQVSLASADILRLGPKGKQTRAQARFTPAGLTAHWVGP